MTGVSTDDYVAIADLLGRYCWYIDGGMTDEWLALWADDGVFVGVAPEPVVGHDALRGIVAGQAAAGGTMCHHVGNLHCDYAGDTDTIRARYYNSVSIWPGAGANGPVVMAICEVRLTRDQGFWMIRRNDTRLLGA